MNNNTLDYNLTKKIYLDFLKENNLYQAKKIFFYENNIEKMANWSNSNFKKTLNWYNKIRKSNKTKVRTIHLEKMKKWNYNKKKGVISHTSGEFFCIEGKRVTNSNREVKGWDQPFIKTNRLQGRNNWSSKIKY